MRKFRYVLFAALTLITLLMAWVTITVPMIAMTGPAILTIALAVAMYLVYPKKAPDR